MSRAHFLDLSRGIRSGRLSIGVIGLGYVGLPLAVAFAKNNFKVIGIDVDRDRINSIRKKSSYITDVSTEELRSCINAGRLRCAENFQALSVCRVVIICVPTPLKRKYQPNISYIVEAVKALKKVLQPGTLVVLESTTYPGTTDEVIVALLQSTGLVCGRDFFLAFSPERIDPGNSSYTLTKIPKVVGGVTRDAGILTALLYRRIIKKVIVVSSARVAETVKLLENTFRIVNIGLIDEMAKMCHAMNLDIWEVIAAAKTKPFGFMPFYPGPGVGGHCIPKDPLYLYWKAKKFGFSSKFIKLASDMISSMPQYVVGRLEAILQKTGRGLNRARVLVLGVTYKRDVRDLRKSPALEIIELLQKKRVGVAYHDPLIPYLKISGINLTSQPLSGANLSAADAVVVVTDHSGVDYRLVRTHARLIFDTRNVYGGIRDGKIEKL